jgi:hypothetical protein
MIRCIREKTGGLQRTTTPIEGRLKMIARITVPAPIQRIPEAALTEAAEVVTVAVTEGEEIDHEGSKSDGARP